MEAPCSLLWPVLFTFSQQELNHQQPEAWQNLDLQQPGPQWCLVLSVLFKNFRYRSVERRQRLESFVRLKLNVHESVCASVETVLLRLLQVRDHTLTHHISNGLGNVVSRNQILKSAVFIWTRETSYTTNLWERKFQSWMFDILSVGSEAGDSFCSEPG